MYNHSIFNKMIVRSRDIDSAQSFGRNQLGAKGYNLACLTERNLAVPAWIALTPAAFFASLEQADSFKEGDAAKRARLSQNIKVAPVLIAEISNCIEELGWQSQRFAVRSSSADEDGSTLSYAGQFLSLLNVEECDLASAIEKVWQSAFTKSLLDYRSLNGIQAPPEPPCVIIQKMVEAKLAGVAFGADPITGKRDIVSISSTLGLADKLVSGLVDSATYRLDAKEVRMRHNEELGRLDDNQLFAIRGLVRTAEEIFSGAQDIEWAIDEDDCLYILQARPITTLEEAAEKVYPQDNCIDIFDNSNIQESYPGITTPLTFSFARKAYQHVYEEFCRLMGVSESSIAKNAYIFPQMLGLVRGRIYYKLLNWYRLLSLFPGFKLNRKFMEQMMGLKAELPPECLLEFQSESSPIDKLKDCLTLALVMPQLIWKWIKLSKDIIKFNRRVEQSLAKAPANLESISTSKLASLYRSLEQDLLLRWDAPIVNDFFAMVSFGVLRLLSAKWLAGADGIHNQLLCGETGIVSTEPIARMKELALFAAHDKTLLNILKNSDGISVDKALADYPQFFRRYQSYLEKFGDRCMGELKLESPTLIDNPMALHRAIANLAIEQSHESASKENNKAQNNRLIAEQQVAAILKDNPIRMRIFNLVLAQTRSRIRERENLRFMRTRVFGTVRRIFSEIGKRLESENVIVDWQDVFYLETEEVLRFVEGVSTSSNLAAIAALRKEEFHAFKSQPAPKDRITIAGGLHLASKEIDKEESLQEGRSEYIGLGCCPGVIRGLARVVIDPTNETLAPGEILVAKRTDPGWITLIAQAKGIVVEYGSLLSHTAIVARELGIPTVVSVSNVTTNIANGDDLEINGATGLVRVLGDERQSVDDAEFECEQMKSEIEQKAGFSFIRYAQCWEDADIVLAAMNIKEGDHCLSIGSAGDNSLAILARNPQRVVALDLNNAQLALMELKAAAFKTLNYNEMLVFLGYRDGDNRLELFGRVREELSEKTQRYWLDRLYEIEEGIVAKGKFEKYFAIFRTSVLPLIHSTKTIDQLLQPKTRLERESFFDNTWNTLRWRLLFKLFFSKPVMGMLGRDPSFFRYAEDGLIESLKRSTKKALVAQDPSKNPYLHWILKGRFGDELPFFLRQENFETIKNNIDKLECRQMSLEEYLSDNKHGRFDSMNLSDIFEYVSQENYHALLQLMARASNDGGRLVYWNMMADRYAGSFEDENIKINPLKHLSETLFADNKTFFYKRFVVEEITRIEEPNKSLDFEGRQDREGKAA